MPFKERELVFLFDVTKSGDSFSARNWRELAAPIALNDRFTKVGN